MSQEDIDNIKKTVSDGLNQAYDTAAAAEAQLSSTTQHVSSTVRKGISTGLESVSATKSKLKVALLLLVTCMFGRGVSAGKGISAICACRMLATLQKRTCV